VADGNVSLTALVGYERGWICYHVAQKSRRTNVLAAVRASSSSALFNVVYPAIIHPCMVAGHDGRRGYSLHCRQQQSCASGFVGCARGSLGRAEVPTTNSSHLGP
jgi:hypothetical protein